MKPSTLKRIIILCFVLVPLLSSIISTVHLVDLFYLGNPSWISYTVAIAIEIGSIASFLTLSILTRLNKSIVWGMFIILFMMQIIGNVYFSYDWITKKIAIDPNWIKNFTEMMSFFVYELEEKTSKMILAMLIGIPIPLISVFLLKSITDYLGTDIEASHSIVAVEPTEATAIPNPSVKELISDHVPFVEKIEEDEKKDDTDQIHIPEDNIIVDDDDEEARRRKRQHPARI